MLFISKFYEASKLLKILKALELSAVNLAYCLFKITTLRSSYNSVDPKAEKVQSRRVQNYINLSRDEPVNTFSDGLLNISF